jgi:hypothetical protein
MKRALVAFISIIFLSIPFHAFALHSETIAKIGNSQGTVTSSSWTLDYPDFVQALKDDKWTFRLKPIAPNTLGLFDSAEFTLKDANGNQVFHDSAYTSSSGGYIEFYDYVYASDLKSVDLTRDFKGILNVKRGIDSELKNDEIAVSIPVRDFPKKPSSVAEYVTFTSSFSSISYPQDCTPIEVQYKFSDPYSEVSTVKFSVSDSKGKEVASASTFFLEEGQQKEDIQICPSDLDGSVGPFSLVTTVSFSSGSGEQALSEKILFPLASKTDEAKAKVDSLGDLCLKGGTSKVVSLGQPCPAGFKKLIFTIPSDIQWNAVSRMPNSQKNKNYVIYACVAQFDANTGGSKFRGYASASPQQYYFSNGVNSIFTGSTSQLLKLSENAEFIAKVTVTGGVSYSTTIGGKISVPSLAIRQFQILGKC